MIPRFGPETALLLIDVQVGVDEVAYWSGRGANRNNPQAEAVMLDLLAAWRAMCVETTTRMAGNLGFDTYLVPEACAAANRVGPDGVDHPAELVHQMAVANLHGEFCTAISPGAAKGLLAADDPSLDRAQGNE